MSCAVAAPRGDVCPGVGVRLDLAFRLISILLALAGLPGPASACSVCLAGDPSYSSQGSTAQAQGDVALYLEARGWRKTSGQLPGEEEEEGGPPGKERNESQRLDLYASWTPINRLTLTLDLPWVFNTITEVEGSTQQTSSLSGFGDLIAQVSGVLWRDRPVLPSTWVEARAFVKLPTGASRQSAGGVQDPHLQVGTGSTDWGLGGAVVHKTDWALLYASGSYRFNSKGSLHYEYGDVLLLNGAVGVPLGHATGVPALDAFTPGLELNYRWSDFDQFRGAQYRDSGGTILYVTPSLRIAIPLPGGRRGPWLRVALQIPVSSRTLHGFQKEYPVWSVGIGHAF